MFNSAVQQLLIHVATVANAGNTKESSKTLIDAVREAQNIGLLLEEPNAGLSEYKQEGCRKVFWGLFIWDSAPTKKAQRSDPATVMAYMKQFQAEILFPTLPPSGQLFKCASMVASRRFTERSLTTGQPQPCQGTEEEQAAITSELRNTLLESCIGGTTSGSQLHRLMGGDAHRYFLIPCIIIESGTTLGMSLVADYAARNGKSDGSPSHHQCHQSRSLDASIHSMKGSSCLNSCPKGHLWQSLDWEF
ncbi:hypothetical protein BJ875DRAFT_493919 [Amylocarpus encephaloides]|uniref:Uncharacterized protein n=1 Tax=Amylocarpus encephaloides TaxID=45428 RepID=A0A9P7YMV3_9HELO|nr:hypothetical protein BJ875DRAFT_493919 [Amylocarpus encephaloides]